VEEGGEGVGFLLFRAMVRITKIEDEADYGYISLLLGPTQSAGV
jgi:hypothetical protein